MLSSPLDWPKPDTNTWTSTIVGQRHVILKRRLLLLTRRTFHPASPQSLIMFILVNFSSVSILMPARRPVPVDPAPMVSKMSMRAFMLHGMSIISNMTTVNSAETHQTIRVRYERMRDALNRTGRPIFYSACEWGELLPGLWFRSIANSWRTTGDISDHWDSMLFNIDLNDFFANYAAPEGNAWRKVRFSPSTDFL